MKYSLCAKALAFSCFATVLTQLPLFVVSGHSSTIAKAIWIVFAFFALLMKRKLRIPARAVLFLGTVVWIAVLMCLLSAVTGTGYTTSSIFTSLLLAAFICMIGLMVGPEFTRDELSLCCRAYAAASVLVGLAVFFQYFWGADISGTVYVYASKNSFAVIMMTAMVILLYLFPQRQKIGSVLLSIVTIVFLGYVIILSKCRAIIVTIPLVAAVYIVFSAIPKKRKAWFIGLCAGVCVLAWNEELMHTFVYDILFAGRGNSWMEASSGRLEMWLRFWEDMDGKWLFGDGTSFREALILGAYMKYGLLIGTAVLAIAFWPLCTGIRMYRATKSAPAFLLMLVALVYTCDSFFEQLAPFGPGVRCFFLWLLLGILLSNQGILYNAGEMNSHAQP